MEVCTELLHGECPTAPEDWGSRAVSLGKDIQAEGYREVAIPGRGSGQHQNLRRKVSNIFGEQKA